MADRAAIPTYTNYRMTIPVREALRRAGNEVVTAGAGDLYAVTLRSPPAGIVDCLIGNHADQHRGLRMHDEPPYPGEWPRGGVAWHEQGQWTPCPKCGGALVWYEAGYVPGYRICTAGHHVQLSADGRSARFVR